VGAGVVVITSARVANFASLSIGGSSCIDASLNAYLAQVYSGGVRVVDGSQNASFNSLYVGGNTCIDSSRNGAFATVSVSTAYKGPNGASGLTGNYSVATPGGGSMVLSFSGGVLTGQW
jgi:hypothetical protein